MSTTELSPPTKLPIWQTAKAGYSETYRNLRAFLTAAALPFALSLLLAATFADAPEGQGFTILHSALDILIVALFELAWYRHLMLQSAETRPRLLPRPGARLLAYLGYAWLLGLAFIPAMLTLEQPTGTEDTASTAHGMLLAQMAAVILLYIFALYLNVRLGFAFLWIAIDETGRLGESWRSTKDNGLRLLAVVMIVAAPFLGIAVIGSVVTATMFPDVLTQLETPEAGGGPFWFGLVAEQTLIYIFYAVGSAAFVHAFSNLTGWSLNQKKILERFD
ncbi:hypothetical protein HBA54_05230 [Pelagibius litoralis]|uniref:Uncharacterized protein n=1 Tax=Pelagibius litoralis TaxID=374515 RepID=A0A967C274_9PROT|nr:hypothetical protein [Pelagibius litoralis]NIA67988.1 hypothetical protein [Pelagibius litoralis]